MTSYLLYLHAVCEEYMNEIVNSEELSSHCRPVIIYRQEVTSELHTIVILRCKMQFFIIVILEQEISLGMKQVNWVCWHSIILRLKCILIGEESVNLLFAILACVLNFYDEEKVFPTVNSFNRLSEPWYSIIGIGVVIFFVINQIPLTSKYLLEVLKMLFCLFFEFCI